MSRVNFVLILLLLFPIVLFGQDRINREKLNFDKISETLEKSTGWEYNSTLGEWIDFDNVISQEKDYNDKYKSLQGRYMMSKTSQNFLKIQTKSVVYKGTEYFMLIIDKWSGRYEYPAIQRDWYEFQLTVGYIFSKEEYQKLQNIENLIELKTQYIVTLGSKYEKYDEVKFLDLIQTALQTEKSKYSSEYTFPILKSTEGVILFYLPEIFSSYSKYNFDKKYFETSFENFSKIILK